MRAGRVPGAQAQRAYAGVGAAVGAADGAALRAHADPGALGRRPRGAAGAHQTRGTARAGPPPAARALRAQAARAAAALVARRNRGRGAARGRRTVLGPARTALGAPAAGGAESEARGQRRQQQKQQREERGGARHGLLRDGTGASSSRCAGLRARRAATRPAPRPLIGRGSTAGRLSRLPGLGPERRGGLPAAPIPSWSDVLRPTFPDMVGSWGKQTTPGGNLPEHAVVAPGLDVRSPDPKLAPTIMSLNPPKRIRLVQTMGHCLIVPPPPLSPRMLLKSRYTSQLKMTLVVMRYGHLFWVDLGLSNFAQRLTAQNLQ